MFTSCLLSPTILDIGDTFYLLAVNKINKTSALPELNNLAGDDKRVNTSGGDGEKGQRGLVNGTGGSCCHVV